MAIVWYSSCTDLVVSPELLDTSTLYRRYVLHVYMAELQATWRDLGFDKEE